METLKVYAGSSHALPLRTKDQVNQDILASAKQVHSTAVWATLRRVVRAG